MRYIILLRQPLQIGMRQIHTDHICKHRWRFPTTRTFEAKGPSFATPRLLKFTAIRWSPRNPRVTEASSTALVRGRLMISQNAAPKLFCSSATGSTAWISGSPGYSMCMDRRTRADDGRAVSNFITQALTGRSITVYGDGSQSRSWGYVDDIVEGLARLFWRDNLDYIGPVNIGNGKEICVIDVANLFLPCPRLANPTLASGAAGPNKPMPRSHIGQAIAARMDLPHGI